MSMLSQVTNGTVANIPAPIQSVAPKIKIEDDGVNPTIKASDAQPGKQYRVGSLIAAYLCTVGDQAQFLPVAGGTPFGVPASTPILAVQESAAAGTAPVQPAQTQAASTSETGKPATAPITVAAPVAPEPVKEAAPEPAKPKKAKKEAAPTETATPAPTAGKYDGVHLYFGCSPIGVTTSTLIPYTVETERYTVSEAIKAGQKVAEGTDLRTCSDPVLGFNKWQAYLEDAVKEVAIAPGHYVVTNGDARVETVARALMGLVPAGNVTMGGK